MQYVTPPSDPDDLGDVAGVSPTPEGASAAELVSDERTNRAAWRWVLATLRYAAPALAAIALVLVMTSGVANLTDDLQLFVTTELPSGARHLPLRALRYGRLLEIDGPSLLHEPVLVTIVTSQGERSSTLTAAASGVLDLEANVELPALKAGDWIQLRARANEENPPLEVFAHVRVRDNLDHETPEGRAVRALQQFSPGPIQAEPGAIAPDALAVRVRGGACVPEQSCKLAVWVGSPKAALRVQSNSTVTASAQAARASVETNDVVILDVMTHGPEAELWLVAERAGQRVARRAVRLPIALATLSVQPSARIVDSASTLQLHSPGASGACIIDAFQGGRWRETGSRAACDKPFRLPFGLGPGLWRLQLRRDAFSEQTAGVASLYVRSPNEPEQQIVAAFARAARELAPDDRFVRACLHEPELCSDANVIEYLAATADIGLLALPRPVTSYAARLSRAREQAARMRWLALVALCLGALGLALSVGRSGVSAGVRVSLLFLDDPRAARRARLRAILLTSASAVSLLMVFGVLALYVLARGGY